MSEKETNCRNPILQKMFMRLGRAEKAGSGVDKIMSGWHFLGWPNPSVREETRPDYVVLSMPIGKPDKKTGQEERTDKKDSESKIGQEKPFITNESQENPTRKPDKKTRQEGAKNAANPIILPRSKILHRNIGTYRTKRPRKLQAHLHRPVDSRREAPHDRAGQPDKPESKVYKHARISVDEAHKAR